MEGCRGQRATRGGQPERRRTAGERRAPAAASSGFPRPFSLSPSIGFNHHSHFLYRSPTPSAQPLDLPGWGLGLGLGLRQPLRLRQFPTPPSGLVTRAAGGGSSARPASARPLARAPHLYVVVFTVVRHPGQILVTLYQRPLARRDLLL